MPFFENIGKQISNVGQNVAQQTKNLAGITQLNSAISDKQGQIQQLYHNLGQAYYEAHRDDPAAEELEMIRQINCLFSGIAQCREKISQIRGSSACPSCGAEVPAAAQFCNACGAKISRPAPVPEEPEGNRCPKCGAEVPEGNLFCSQCGNRL